MAFERSSQMQRPEGAAATSPRQSPGAKRKDGTLGKPSQRIMCALKGQLHTRCFIQLPLQGAGWGCAWLPRALPWADSSWAFSPTCTLCFASHEPALALTLSERASSYCNALERKSAKRFRFNALGEG